MLIGWMMCASTALILTKYYKPMWPNDRLCGTKVWLAVSYSYCFYKLGLSLSYLVIGHSQFHIHQITRQFDQVCCDDYIDY